MENKAAQVAKRGGATPTFHIDDTKTKEKY
jgi:hypothetical protein